MKRKAKSASVRRLHNRNTSSRAAPLRSRKRHNRESSGLAELLYRIMLAAACVSVVLFVITMFFRVAKIEVVGNERYSVAEIRVSSGISEGDRLFFINRLDSAQAIFDKLPYVDEVKVKLGLPDRITLEVRECEQALVLPEGNLNYILDKEFKILEITPLDPDESLPRVDGIKLLNPKAGKSAVFENELAESSLRSIYDDFLLDEIADKLGTVHMERLYDIYFTYDDYYLVYIGDTGDAAKKVVYLKEVIRRLDGENKGTISVKNLESISFRPGAIETEEE